MTNIFVPDYADFVLVLVYYGGHVVLARNFKGFVFKKGVENILTSLVQNKGSL